MIKLHFADHAPPHFPASYGECEASTPFGMSLSTAQNRGIFDLTQANALRAPAHFRLDLRVGLTFTVKGGTLIVYGGAQNLTNRQNWAENYRDRRPNTVATRHQLGLFPIFGIDWRFRAARYAPATPRLQRWGGHWRRRPLVLPRPELQPTGAEARRREAQGTTQPIRDHATVCPRVRAD